MIFDLFILLTVVDADVTDIKDRIIPWIFIEGRRAGYHGEAYIPVGESDSK